MGGAIPSLARLENQHQNHQPAPTAPEVSQSTATAMDGYDSRKTKARGRSTTILTGPRGVEEETPTLGRRSLLGK